MQKIRFQSVLTFILNLSLAKPTIVFIFCEQSIRLESTSHSPIDPKHPSSFWLLLEPEFFSQRSRATVRIGVTFCISLCFLAMLRYLPFAELHDVSSILIPFSESELFLSLLFSVPLIDFLKFAIKVAIYWKRYPSIPTSMQRHLKFLKLGII